MNVTKVLAKDLPGQVFQGLAKISLPTFCDMLNQNKSNKSSNPYYVPSEDEDPCSAKPISVLSKSEAVSAAGQNGFNETRIDSSSSVSLKLTHENNSEIAVKNLKNKIHFYIPRNPTLGEIEFKRVNTSNLTLKENSPFLANGLNINAMNTSVFIQIKPADNCSYFIWVKYGDTPVSNDTYDNFDELKGFCPRGKSNRISISNDSHCFELFFIKDLKNESNQSYYQFFSNYPKNNQFKGFVGFGIREMSSNEFDLYCAYNTNATRTPLQKKMSNFSQDFSIRIFTSGCYYYDEKTGKWSSDGVETIEDTNMYYTHCIAEHLTTFAGGFVVLPAEINFEKVWANASFAQNPTIYVTVIVLSSLFILLAVWARYSDIKDAEKLGLNLLIDNQKHHEYTYEMVVFTGSRSEAATDSIVRFILAGENGETGVRILSDPNRRTFRRSAVDSFIMTVQR